jgi:hypothetical protein
MFDLSLLARKRVGGVLKVVSFSVFFVFAISSPIMAADPFTSAIVKVYDFFVGDLLGGIAFASLVCALVSFLILKHKDWAAGAAIVFFVSVFLKVFKPAFFAIWNAIG